MDHISRALERAQAERSGVRSWVLPSPSEQQDPAVVQPAVRKITLSAAHLKERHILSGRGREDPAITDVYRLLRTRVTQLMAQRGWHTVGVTSAGPRAGKSLTAINLAISMARDSAHSVVLVDADLRRPSVADTLGLPESVGLIDYLNSGVELGDVLQASDIDNLLVLPGRHEASGVAVSELLTSNKMSSLIQSVRGREKSSLVVVDLPPVLVGDDVVAVAPFLDCLLIVIEEGKTEIEELRHTAELIKGFNLLGTVLNKSAEKSKHFASYYYHSTGVATSSEAKSP
jgi:protein-tyrosine kinase